MSKRSDILTLVVIANLIGNLLSGCAKSEVREAPLELTLRPVTVLSAGDLLDDSEPATKADPELTGTTLGTTNTYVVYASASSANYPQFLTGQLFSYTPANRWEASSAIGTADPVYWPAATTMDFLAIACTPAAKAALDANLSWNATSSADGFTIADWDTWSNQYDVMWSLANGKTQSDNAGVVNMEFKHACALLSFTAKSTVTDVVKIHGLTLNNLGYQGTFSVDNSVTDAVAEWGTLTKADKKVYGLDGTTGDYDFDVPTAVTKCTQNLLVPQQASTSITLSYTTPGIPVPLDYLIRIPRTNWKAGYKYTYALEFTPYEIIITEEVVTWDGSSVPEITID